MATPGNTTARGYDMIIVEPKGQITRVDESGAPYQ
jgi:hypothetical protein